MAEVVLSEIRGQLRALHGARERPVETLESVAGDGTTLRHHVMEYPWRALPVVGDEPIARGMVL